MRFPLALAAVLAALALPAAASGAVTIGSNLAASGTLDNLGSYCPGSGNCTGTNQSLPPGSTAANGLTSPINGVVVKWRVKSGSSGNPVALRVLRFTTGTTYRAVRTSTPGTTNGSIAETASRVQIAAGDSVGLNIGNSALIWASTPGATGVVWGSVNGFPTGLADGQTAQGDGRPYELLVQAVVEPDADGDGFGDETQDGCPADPARQTPSCGTGPTNPNGNPPPTPTPTPTAPVITGYAVVPASFRLGSLAQIRFRLSQAASYDLTFDRILPGRKRGRRCVLQSRTVRTGVRCAVYLRRAAISGSGRAGLNTLAFRGRVAGRPLTLGRYRLTFGAVGPTRLVAKTRSRTFTLLPALRRR
ncbi:MAG: hypothetical protein QOI91_2351 [Solirubrobacteraceae bacterium]|jgi:hypothetical protein|nr:hypothetical protein [Solirubrobacteraceae bacterium]